jgi:5-methylcytosine-specific restriction protein A
MAGLRPCLGQDGVRCPVLVPSHPPGNRCAAHGGEPKSWTKRAKPDVVATPRLRGRANQRRRANLFAREPLCRECAKQGRVTIATIRDHIVPLGEGGAEGVDENEQPLCQSCSDIKTAAESARGVRREW